MAELRKLTTKWTFDTTEYIDGVSRGIDKTKTLTATTESGMKEMEKHVGELGKKINLTADEFDVVSAAVKKADQEAKKADKAYKGLSDELEREAKMLTMTEQEQRIFNAQLRLGKGATDAQRQSIKNLIIANDQLARSNGKTTGSFRMMRNGASQMQYQLQDIAVQMQMGTNPFTILGQQGPQIASLFGPGGAVFGSIIAFGAMFGGVALSSLLDMKDATEELEEAQSDLNDVIKQTSESGVTLTGVFGEVVEKYSFLADEVRSIAMEKQLKVATSAAEVLKDAFIEIDSTAAKIDSSGINTLSGGILAGGKVVQETTYQFTELKGVIDDIGENGANAGNVLDLALAIDSLATEDASDEMKALKQTLIEQLDVLRDSVGAMADLEDANKDLSISGKETAESNGKNKDSIVELIEKLEQEAITYGMTADAIVLYNAALQGATDEQLQAIRNSQEIINAKKDEEQAFKDARKAEEKDLKDKEKREKNYSKLMDQATNDQLKRWEKEEQAKRDLESMKQSIAMQGFDNLAELAEEGSALAKFAFLGQQLMAANEVMIRTEATKAKYFDNPAMLSLIEGQKYASLATIAGTTIAGVMHGGGVVPDSESGNKDQTYMLQGGEYVESRAERREIDKLVNAQSEPMNLNLSYTINAMESKGVKQVLLENNKTVYAAVQQAMRSQGKTL